MLKEKINNLKYILSRPIYSIRNYINDRYETYIRYLSGSTGDKKRYKYYKKRLKYIGENVKIDTGVFISFPQNVSIGSGTHIDKNCMIIASSEDLDLSYRYIKNVENPNYEGKKGEIFIGEDCHIAQNTMVFGAGGVYIGNRVGMSAGAKVYSLTSLAYNPFDRSEEVSILPFSGKSPSMLGPVVMKDDVWIGLDAVVNPGCTLEENVFACAGAMILSSFPSNSYIGGVPAKYLKERFNVGDK